MTQHVKEYEQETERMITEKMHHISIVDPRMQTTRSTRLQQQQQQQQNNNTATTTLHNPTLDRMNPRVLLEENDAATSNNKKLKYIDSFDPRTTYSSVSAGNGNDHHNDNDDNDNNSSRQHNQNQQHSLTYRRPDVRVNVALPPKNLPSPMMKPMSMPSHASSKTNYHNFPKYNKVMKHDDVIMVPNFFGTEDDYSLYYKLLEEFTTAGTAGAGAGGGSGNGGRGSTTATNPFVSWHEGSHLIVKTTVKEEDNDKSCFNYVVQTLLHYFHIDPKSGYGTRINYYKDQYDWKPYHHDSAYVFVSVEYLTFVLYVFVRKNSNFNLVITVLHFAPIITTTIFLKHIYNSAFDVQRSKHLNITISVSFGQTRELGFLRKHNRRNGHGSDDGNNHNNQYESCNCHISFPQHNNMVFTFGRDVNIRYMHGIDAPICIGGSSGNGRSISDYGSSGKSTGDEEEEDQGAKTKTKATTNTQPSSSIASPTTTPITSPTPTGRISIIIWGWAQQVVEEPGSPPLLT